MSTFLFWYKRFSEVQQLQKDNEKLKQQIKELTKKKTTLKS